MYDYSDTGNILHFTCFRFHRQVDKKWFSTKNIRQHKFARNQQHLTLRSARHRTSQPSTSLTSGFCCCMNNTIGSKHVFHIPFIVHYPCMVQQSQFFFYRNAFFVHLLHFQLNIFVCGCFFFVVCGCLGYINLQSQMAHETGNGGALDVDPKKKWEAQVNNHRYLRVFYVCCKYNINISRWNWEIFIFRVIWWSWSIETYS